MNDHRRIDQETHEIANRNPELRENLRLRRECQLAEYLGWTASSDVVNLPGFTEYLLHQLKDVEASND